VNPFIDKIQEIQEKQWGIIQDEINDDKDKEDPR